MTDATFTTTCARCAAPLEVTDATVDAVSKAHEATCIIPGDDVRWEFPLKSLWAEGRFVSSTNHGFWTEHRLIVSAASDGWDSACDDDDDDVPPPVAGTERKFGTDDHSGTNIRRVPRPEQAVAPDSEAKRQTLALGDVAEWRLDGLTWERVTVVRAYPGDKFEIEHERTAERWQVHRSELRRVVGAEPAVDPLDVEYDGVTLRVLLDLDRGWRDETRFVGPGGPGRALTPAQRAAVSAHWSAQLRARLSASSERERLTVVAPDLELETANCKDAE